MKYCRLAIVISLLVIVVVGGCAGKTSSLLLGRFAHGPLIDARSVAQPLNLSLTPTTITTVTGREINVTVTHATRSYQDKLFSDKTIFGDFAGKNPYYLNQLVFYVLVSNQSSEEVFVDLAQFKLVDNRGNQMPLVGYDHIAAMTEDRSPVATTTRGIVESARPGYFGLSFPIGSLFKQSQWRYALLQQSALKSGFLYPNVIHDGLIAFWTPSNLATELTLHLSNIKTDFDASGEPTTSLDYVFEFEVTHE